MAGVSKHYVLRGGVSVYLDHACIARLDELIRGHHRPLADVERVLEEAYRQPTWRAKILFMWSAIRSRVSRSYVLTEHLVYPKRFYTKCLFRQYARSHRAFFRRREAPAPSPTPPQAFRYEVPGWLRQRTQLQAVTVPPEVSWEDTPFSQAQLERYLDADRPPESSRS